MVTKGRPKLHQLRKKTHGLSTVDSRRVGGMAKRTGRKGRRTSSLLICVSRPLTNSVALGSSRLQSAYLYSNAAGQTPTPSPQHARRGLVYPTTQTRSKLRAPSTHLSLLALSSQSRSRLPRRLRPGERLRLRFRRGLRLRLRLRLRSLSRSRSLPRRSSGDRLRCGGSYIFGRGP